MTVVRARWVRFPAVLAGVVVLAVSAPSATAEYHYEEPFLGSAVPVAGTGAAGDSGDGGHALAAALNHTLSLDVAADGGLYIADSDNGRVREVTADGTIDTVSGDGTWWDVLDEHEHEHEHEQETFLDIWNTMSPVRQSENVDDFVPPQAVAVDESSEVYIATPEDITRMDAEGEVTTVAGGGEQDFADGGDGGDGGPASDASISDTSDIDVDAEGNLYIADRGNDRIRMVDTDGDITTLVGGGEESLPGDADDAVTATQIDIPDALHRVAVDSMGQVFFTFGSDATVYRVDSDGVVEVAAGGAEGYAGDGGPATEAQLGERPGGLAVDEEDTLYIADPDNNAVRTVDAQGTTDSVAVRFSEANDAEGAAPRSDEVSDIQDVALGPDGQLHVAGNNQVSKVPLEDGDPVAEPAEPGPDPWADEDPGTVRPVAGTEQEPAEEPDTEPDAGDTEPAAAGVQYVAVDDEGRTYVSDPTGHKVRAVDPDGEVTTVAGTGAPGFSGDGGQADEARLNHPHGLAVDEDGQLYIADRHNHRVRVVDDAGDITTLAGPDIPEEAAVDAWLADEVDEFVETEEDARNLDEEAIHPTDVAVDPDGSVYFADYGSDFTALRGFVREVDADGEITTVAGGRYTQADDEDTGGSDHRLPFPQVLEVDGSGNFYVIEGLDDVFDAEFSPDAAHRIDSEGVVHTFAEHSGSGHLGSGFAGDGGPVEEARLDTPLDLAVDEEDRLYIADSGNHRVRMVDAAGDITTVMGTGEPNDSGDDGPAEEAGLREPGALAAGPDDTMMLTTATGDRLRQVDPDGTITTIVELARIHDDVPDETATETELDSPHALATDHAGHIYLADSGVVRRIEPGGDITTLPPWRPGGPELESLHERSRDQSAVFAEHSLADLAAAPDGELYVSPPGLVFRASPEAPVLHMAGGGPLPAQEGASAQHTDLGSATVTTGPDGELYIGTEDIYRLEPDGTLTVHVDELDPDQSLAGFAVGDDGRTYASAAGRVRVIEPDGEIDTLAGGGDSDNDSDSDSTDEDAADDEEDLGDEGQGTDAVLNDPGEVAVDEDDTVYVTSADGIRMVSARGTIDTLVDYENPDLTPSSPFADHRLDALTLDAHGNLYYLDPDTTQVKVVVRPGETIPPMWPRITLNTLAVLLVLMLTLGIALRGQLGMLARQPRRIPTALAMLGVLLLVNTIDLITTLTQRFGPGRRSAAAPASPRQ